MIEGEKEGIKEEWIRRERREEEEKLNEGRKEEEERRGKKISKKRWTEKKEANSFVRNAETCPPPRRPVCLSICLSATQGRAGRI